MHRKLIIIGHERTFGGLYVCIWLDLRETITMQVIISSDRGNAPSTSIHVIEAYIQSHITLTHHAKQKFIYCECHYDDDLNYVYSSFSLKYDVRF